MKKIIFAAAIAAVLCLGACTGQTTEPQQSEPTAQATEAPTAVPTAEPTAVPSVLIQAEEVSQVTEDWSETAKYRYDIDGDGERESIRLCVDARSDDNGSPLLDDGNRWILETVDASGTFTLYSGYIQLGTPYFEVYEDKDKNQCIGLVISTSSGYEIKKFTYIKDKKAFDAQNVYSETGINRLYSSME